MPDLKTTQETLRSPIDGTELVRLATAGANWQAPLSTVFTSVPGPWTMNGSPLTINGPNQSTKQGLTITQIGPTAGTTVYNSLAGNEFYYNNILVTNDSVVNAAGNAYTEAFDVTMYTGPNDGGSKGAIRGTLIKQFSTTPGVGRDHVAVIGSAVIQSPDGGTNTGAGAKGTGFGLVGAVLAQSGATNYLQLVGIEADAAMITGSSAKNRYGVSSVAGGEIQAASTYYDAGYEVAALSATAPWKFGILFSKLHGADPVGTTGTLIGTDNLVGTVANGIDLSQYIFTGNFLKSSKFSVAGSGLVTIAPTAATSTQGLVINQSGSTTDSNGGGAVGVNGTGFAYNQVFLSSDARADFGTSPYTYGTQFYMQTGGANARGSKIALSARINRTAPDNTAQAYGDTIAGNFAAQSNSDDGGTGVTQGTARGTLFGLGVGATAGPGATNMFIVSGAEVDVGINTGASSYGRIGWSIVGTGQLQGASIYDMALEIAASGKEWKTGIMFSTLHGTTPVSTTGTLIGTDANAQTVANGIDFSQYTITGNFLKGTNFTVDGSGNIANGTTSASTWFLPGAATTAKSIMRLPVGGPPSAPLDGDVWREDNTNTGVKIRINGVTKTFTLS